MADISISVELGGILSATIALVVFVRKCIKDIQRAKQEHAEAILKKAREEDQVLKNKLEARMEAFKVELKNLEFNVNKDISHLRETHLNEIKNLGEKIESLRSELSAQHSSLLALLTSLVNK